MHTETSSPKTVSFALAWREGGGSQRTIPNGQPGRSQALSRAYRFVAVQEPSSSRQFSHQPLPELPDRVPLPAPTTLLPVT